ncbi:MAG: hypothetical protein JWP91_4058 [Fibrobacteres bacterium]|nr:hypothetical protein [Fibrobacterota bacterium]
MIERKPGRDMKNLFEAASVAEVRERIERLKPDSQRQWGKMNPAQALAHCAGGLEMALGELRPPRNFMGRLIGGVIKKLALGNDEPMRKNTPTVKGMTIVDERVLGAERERVKAMIGRFVEAGPEGCTTHPHAFFGKLKPEEWGVLMYKHLDHHLRQFGV